MSDDPEPEASLEPPGPPDRRGIDPGTWILVIVCLLLTLTLLAWFAQSGPPVRG